MFLLVSLILIAVISITTFIIIVEKNEFEVPEIEDISSVKIIPFKVGGGTRDEFIFDLNKKEQKDTVNSILNWLKNGHIEGYAKGEFVSIGSSPTCLVILLKNGTSIEVTSTVGSIVTKIPNGTRVQSQSIPGQVTIYVSNKRNPIRVFSPELKSFIDNGWKAYFNSTKQ